MLIVRAHEFGGPEKLVVETEATLPEPAAGQVRITVTAAGVNPVDWKLLSGKAPVLPPLPLVPGGDIAGVVDAVGSDVDSFAVGDRVFAHPGLTGGYAGQVAVDARSVAKIPDNVQLEEAAVVPLAALTAWQSFAKDGRNLEGLHVLVHNGAGGVGNAAIQIAKAKGAQVTATASETKADFVRTVGADSVVDFRQTPVAGRAKDVDILIDLVGDSEETGLWSLIREDGSVIRVSGGPKAPDEETRDGVRAYKFRVKPNGAQLQEIASLLGQGKFRPIIERSYPVTKVVDAVRHVMAGHARGKIVITFN